VLELLASLEPLLALELLELELLELALLSLELDSLGAACAGAAGMLLGLAGMRSRWPA
jgi:hypothetical protein